ncbi:MAG: hypothetical protein ACKOB4_18405 [Acidobacteriota bacterium]
MVRWIAWWRVGAGAYKVGRSYFQDSRHVIPYHIELIDSDQAFNQFAPRLAAAPVLAIDIETINWWSREEERISIVQIGFREDDRLTVAICDTLAGWSPEPLRHPLELGLQVKVMHNASFDAVKLERHYGIRTSPVHDTMLAARRNGEKGCTLKDLVGRHLGVDLDKTEQRGDWSVRPLRTEQLRYAALDVVFTLLIYELQAARGMHGDYVLKSPASRRPPPAAHVAPAPVLDQPAGSALGMAILRIVDHMPGRYGVQNLVATISSERSGLVGWILDQTIGPLDLPASETIIDEIGQLIRMGNIRIDENGRLETVGNRTAIISPEPEDSPF